MHLRSGELMFGVAPTILIDCARQLHRLAGQPFTLDDFCMALGAPIREAKPVLAQMISEGFISTQATSSSVYLATPKLGQLALSNISEGLPRAQADALLTRILDQAESVNADPLKHRCEVVRIVVFGSYLTEKEVLGDLDIGVELKELPRQHEQDWNSRYRDLLRGLATPASKVKSLLRLRKPKQISIHDLAEVLRLGTPYRLVFGEQLDSTHASPP
ncbi:hypothetical protein [Pseudorhodoferax sp.]|uniref:hypothetical protein n=1 Tax=Pseudorhodoferax sp. TaxID=1993553 RepID=UPI0039E47F31